MSVGAIVAIVAGILGSAGLGGVLKTWLDHQRGKRKQTDDVAMGLVEKLEKRIEKLEADLDLERARCDAELRVLRHRMNNQRTMIYSLLHLFDVPAGKRKDMLAGIRTELAALEQAEATEKGAVVAATIESAAS